MSNRLTEIMQLGQSVWYDNIRRAMITSGDLQKKIEEDDLRGVTSNPTIFEKAITGSADYDEQLRRLVQAGKGASEIYEDLVAEDIGNAADILLPVYERTDGLDGYISLEVSPRLAYDTAGTIDEATRLFERVGRKNVMIKIPAAQEGLPAIEESIYRGININITMIFSIENYEQVAEAFVKGLERRAAEGKNVDHIASVASFFVSRVDTAIDADLEYKARHASSPEEKRRLENLCGRETVNTVPPATYTAIRDHGRVELTLEEGLDECRALIEQLAEVGIDLKAVTEKLQRDGLAAFVNSFDTLVESIEAKRDTLLSGINERLTASLGKYADAVSAAIKEAEKGDVMRRVWRKEAALWKSEEEHQKIIKNSLGWLNVADQMIGVEDDLVAFADRLREKGFRHVVLNGMGGSSLAPEVLRRTFGKQEDYPELLVLDSTDPDTVADYREKIDPAQTLFVVSSKSGTTTEPLMFYRYWFGEVGKVKENPGENFLAVTDPGTKMEADATRDKFKRVFLNPPDIGGRYSALSYFGMVPAALMGVDIRKLLDRAERVMHACSQVVPASENPGARLGAIIGECAQAGRDKLTIVADPKVESFGLWVEQLIAESTGKEGKGVVPVAGEPLAAPSAYGDDRLFVSIAVGRPDSETESRLKALEAAGHPVVYRTLTDLYDLGEEFFLWEIATAFAGWRLGINPFDQPNVQESKDATKELLEKFERAGKLEEQTAPVTDGTLTIFAEGKYLETLPSTSVTDALRAHLSQVKAGDYLAMLAYIEETPDHEAVIQEIRNHLRDATRCATTTGYGPRFLHSTGQLHKGGPASGVFMQLTAADARDVEIPGEPFTFSTLKQAQALGDFRSLSTRGRRAVRVELGADATAGLRRLHEIVREALPVSEATGAS